VILPIELQNAGFTPALVEDIDRLAVGCGGFIKELIGFTSGASATKDGSGQILSAADEMVDLLLRERLLDLLPGCSGYSEEGGEFGERSAGAFHVRWLIDPLDGTRPALLGGAFAVSLGALILRDNHPVAAVGWVYVPTLPALYRGIVSAEGTECTLNGRDTTAFIPSAENLHNCYFAVGSDWDSTFLPRLEMKLSAPGATAVHLTRLVHPGSDYAAVCLSRYKPYDAAGGLVVAAAGGCRLYQPADSELPDEPTDPLGYLASLADAPAQNGPRTFIAHPEVAEMLRRR
jgi:fructose-1,6-bisphosphatase/inositol monophosphatase family enzyme